MSSGNPLTERLGISHPIIQAPMAGGATTAELVAAVSEAGGLGFIGAAYMTPEQITDLAQAVRARTSRPFGINLFSPVGPLAAPPSIEIAVAQIATYHTELGLPAPPAPTWSGEPFNDQMAAVLETDASVFSFTFAIPPTKALDAAKARGVTILGTATTVHEAIALEEAGVDAVVAQGSEAGAHRGTFLGSFDAAMIGTMALVPQVADAISLPVIAAGGIMDGRGIAASRALGAEAVQMGTAFLTCVETGIPDAHKAAILSALEQETSVTRAFSGRDARGIVNRFMTEVEAAPDAILPYPLQNMLTRPLRTAAGKAGHAEFLSLWAGQGLRLSRVDSAADLVRTLVLETERAIERLRA
jgi:nitronate monooxygenase